MEGTLSPMQGMALTMASALVIFLIGFFLRRRYKKLTQVCVAQTSGIVSDFARTENIDTDRDNRQKRRKRYVYYPVFVYTVDGKEITKTSSSGSSNKRFTKGQAVTVCYNPDNVEQYYVLEDKTAARGGLYVMAFGVLLVAIGLMIPFFS